MLNYKAPFLTAEQARIKAEVAEASESHILEYVQYLLGQIESAASRSEFSLTVVKTRSDLVTAKAIEQLRHLGYKATIDSTELSNELYISWEG